MNSDKIAIRGSTQEFTEVAGIRNNLVLMRDGSVALLVAVSAVNFGLLSEREQEAIIYAYAGFLNSLNFAVQIVIRNQRKDISTYVALLDEEQKKQTNPLLARQIEFYKQFILQTVKENNVLDKDFFVVIPFSSLELGVSSTTGGLFKRQKDTLPLPEAAILEKAAIALNPKRDHVLRQFNRLGLRARQLTTGELVDLFYRIYNQEKETNTTDAGTKFENLT